MKKNVLKAAMVVALSFVMVSCYTFTGVVGEGSKTGEVVVGKNHYVVNGLAPISTANMKELTGGAKNYEFTITHSFVDGLLSAITGGIYTPTTVTIKK